MRMANLRARACLTDTNVRPCVFASRTIILPAGQKCVTARKRRMRLVTIYIDAQADTHNTGVRNFLKVVSECL